MPKTRKFIDKKKAVTFHLVHRSQQDPLIADEKAPQHVLVPASLDPAKKQDTAKRKEEQKKFGIYFDDDYDYLQHLRDVNQTSFDWEPAPQSNQTTKLKLPSSVFASQVEENVGLLNKAAPHSGPRLDLDPDVVAAMDEDFDYNNPDNELEDNFIELAKGAGEDSEDDSYDSNMDDDSFDANVSDDEEDDDVASLNGPQYTFTEEETKSRFTNYSMSSSVIRRNEQLTILDDRFEQMFVKCYGDSEIGPLECEEIEGHLEPNSDIVLECALQMEKERKLQRPGQDSDTKENDFLDREYSDDGEDLEALEVQEDPRDRWDCESVLSTYSNIYNRPKVIEEPVLPKKIRVSRKTGIPLDVLNGGSKLTSRALAQHNVTFSSPTNDDGAESVLSTLSVLSLRPKNETPEERTERKKALKNYRKERRLEKKANILAFKEEKKRQEKVMLNNKANIQGLHIL